MDPCRLRACEALAESLAVKPESLSLPQRSTQQEMLIISSHLIYLHGLVAVEPPYTPEHRESFAYLQDIYIKASKTDDKVNGFCLSPSMRPSKEDWKRIQKDIQQKMTDLETQAKQTEQELLALAAREKKAKKKAKAKKQRKAASSKPAREQENNINDPSSPETTKKETETLQQVLAQIQVPHYDTGTSIDSDEWVEVGKSKPKPKEMSTAKTQTQNKSTPKNNSKQESMDWPEDENQEPNDKKELVVADNSNVDASFIDGNGQVDVTLVGGKEGNAPPEEPAAVVSSASDNNPSSASAKSDAEVAWAKEYQSPSETEVDNIQANFEETTLATRSHAAHAKSNMEVVVVSLAVKKECPGVPKEDLAATKSVKATPDATTIQKLQDRVRELEQALVQTEQDRLEQQQQYTRNLSKERELSEQHLQALQLRLYISETRLKTYEDALADHVKAVATNVAGGGSPVRKSDESLEESPGKRPWLPSVKSGNTEPTPSLKMRTRPLSAQAETFTPVDDQFY